MAKDKFYKIFKKINSCKEWYQIEETEQIEFKELISNYISIIDSDDEYYKDGQPVSYAMLNPEGQKYINDYEKYNHWFYGGKFWWIKDSLKIIIGIFLGWLFTVIITTNQISNNSSYNNFNKTKDSLFNSIAKQPIIKRDK